MSIKLAGTSLSFLEIQQEFNASGAAQTGSISQFFRAPNGLVTPNNGNVPQAGAISFSQFYDAYRVVPFAREFGPGDYQITVEQFAWLYVDLRGGGGGGGGSAYDIGANGSPGLDGGYSSIGELGISAAGGQGSPWVGLGAPRVIINSSYNYNNHAANGWGSGGNAQYGGGGAGGEPGVYGTSSGGWGGNGGRTTYTWTRGQIAVKTVLNIHVGSGGAGGAGNNNGKPGGSGYCYISWGY